MADALVKHAFVSAVPEGTDATKIRTSNWNAPLLFTGGSVGEILTRDAGATGAGWSASVASLDILTNPAIRVSYLGDSIVNQTLPTWPDYLATYAPALAKAGNVVNYGISGERASLMVTNYTVEAHVNRPTRTIDEGWFFLQAGGNDIADGVAVATVYGYLTSLWASARADGYQVVAMTVLPRSTWGPSGSQALVDALNVLILSDATLYDYLVRADLVLNNPANAAWFYDTTHPTVLGAQMIAQTVATTLNNRPWTLSLTAGVTGKTNAGLLLNPGGAAVTIAAPAIGIVSTDRLVLANDTLSTAAVTVQQSPSLRFRSHVWNTTATAADNLSDWKLEPQLGSAAAPTSTLRFLHQFTPGAATAPLTISATGAVTIAGTSSSALLIALGELKFYMGGGFFGMLAASQWNLTNSGGTIGVGLDAATNNVLKVRTRAHTAYATVDALGYSVGGVAGASKAAGAVTSITVVNGIVTAIS